MLGEGAQADVVQDAQLLEQADILKGPGNPGGGDAVAAPVADVLAPESESALALMRKTPVMRLKTVVLPAPLGPMSPTSSPGKISREKSVRAWRPPKLWERSVISRMGCMFLSVWLPHMLRFGNAADSAQA